MTPILILATSNLPIQYKGLPLSLTLSSLPRDHYAEAVIVRAAIRRRVDAAGREEAEFQCATEFSDDCVASCPWLKFDCEGHAFGSFMDGYHVLYDKHSRYGPIAQRLEQQTHNLLVPGSNPGGPTKVAQSHAAKFSLSSSGASRLRRYRSHLRPRSSASS